MSINKNSMGDFVKASFIYDNKEIVYKCPYCETSFTVSSGFKSFINYCYWCGKPVNTRVLDEVNNNIYDVYNHLIQQQRQFDRDTTEWELIEKEIQEFLSVIDECNNFLYKLRGNYRIIDKEKTFEEFKQGIEKLKQKTKEKR